MENASSTLLEAVATSMKPIRTALGATVVDPKLPTSAERLQYEGYLRREEPNAIVTELAADGASIKEIVRRTGRSRKLVRLIVRCERSDVVRARQGWLDRHLPFLDAQWEAGCRNRAELWRRLRAPGFGDSTRVVSEWATRPRRSERMTTAQLRRPPSARTIARLMTLKRDHLTKAETLTVAAIQDGAPALAEARALVDRFQSIVRRRAVADLDPWLRDAEPSLIASFARGITKDLAAVRAAVAETWSNGQTEGHVNRLKLVKRQMYGRAKLEILEARLLKAAHPDKRIALWFQDEARVGQKGRLCHRWWTKGKRPPGRCDQRFEWTYIFGAVEPATGASFALVLPYADKLMMNLYLAEFAKTVPADTHVVMVLDGAGWHGHKALDVPENITLVTLPPYSPELNPVERLWLYLQDTYVSLQVFKDKDAIVDPCCHAWNNATKDVSRIISLCNYPWIKRVSS